MQNEPRDHHYAPQFYLKNFATDPEKKKINTLSKNGHVMVWSQKSIKSVGVERDLYIHKYAGTPISVESTIGNTIESPISKSETWHKITSGASASIDQRDKAIIYSIIRHFEARTPHYRDTFSELVRMASNPTSIIPFSDEERDFYRTVGKSKNLHDAILNRMASTLEWTERSFKGSALTILRSEKQFRSSTTPVLAIRAAYDPAVALPYPGMTPFQLVLPLDRYTAAVLVLGDFDGAFDNIEVLDPIVQSLNRQCAGRFCTFPKVRHLITEQDDLVLDLKWAHHELIEVGARAMKFRPALTPQ